jgi:hypothetical protein
VRTVGEKSPVRIAEERQLKRGINILTESEDSVSDARGIYMILALYADDSTDKKLARSDAPERIMSAGSFFGWPGSFFDAERKWEHRLTTDGLDYFRASECEALEGEFRPEKLGMSLNSARAFADSVRHDLCKILAGMMGISGIAVSLAVDEFTSLIQEIPDAVEYHGRDPVVYLYRKLIRSSLELLEQDWPQSRGIPVAFTFDIHTKWRQAEEAYNKVREDAPLYEDRMGTVSHMDDKKHPPLQMADLMAHEARHEAKAFIAGTEASRPCLKQLKQTKAVYYSGIVRREQLITEFKEKRL